MRYLDEEISVPIPMFEKYHVTSHGRVLNSKTGRDMVFTPTQFGDMTVGLMRDGKQHRRSVKVLVAMMFVERPEHEEEVFDTPIQLDGNRENLRADNILWRPRWFAVRYAKQFQEPIPSWHYVGPIYEVNSNWQYDTILEAAITNGQLCSDIHNSVLYDTPVFPHGSHYTSM
jgi:hypothetical protein